VLVQGQLVDRQNDVYDYRHFELNLGNVILNLIQDLFYPQRNDLVRQLADHQDNAFVKMTNYVPALFPINVGKFRR